MQHLSSTISLLVLAVGFAFGIPSTQAQSSSADQPTPKPVIAVIPKGTTHEFWKSVHAGAAQAAKDLDVQIIWKGPIKEDDREQQIAVVEDFITQKVSGIVLAPLDDTALRRPVRAAVKAGINVVIIDSDLKSTDQISFVATDNLQGGKIAGQHLAQLLHGKGNVIMLRYQEGSASTSLREQGFLDAITQHNQKHADHGMNIQIVSSNQYGGATSATAQDASEQLLARYKTADGKALTIDGIFCPNESTTFGMLRALQNAQLAGQVKFVGFDASQPLIKALENDQIDALVVQNPMRMGYLGVKTMVQHLRNQPVEKRIDTGVGLVTKNNLHQPETQTLLNPQNP